MISRKQNFFLALSVLALAGLFLTACNSGSSGGARQIQFNLNDSLKKYDKVVITLLDAKDTVRVLDTAFAGKLSDPKAMGAYTLPENVGSDFIVRVQGFDQQGLLAMQSTVAVLGGSAGEPKKTPPQNLPALIAGLSGAKLSLLETSAGALSPAFHPDSFAYNIELPYASDSLALAATPNDSLAVLTLNGDRAQAGLPTAKRFIPVGVTSLKIGVQPPGGTLANYYALTIQRKPGTEDRLDSLTVSDGKLAPAFSPDSLTYALTVGADVELVNLLGFPKDHMARISMNAVPQDSSWGNLINLSPGTVTAVIVKVVSPDSSVSKEYTLNVKRPLSDDGALSSITLSTGNLVPPFDPDLFQYTATIPANTVSIIPTARQTPSVINLNGNATGNAVASSPINLPVGLTVAILSATAPDGKSKRSYSLTFNRASPDAFLTDLKVSVGKLDSAFRSDRLHYSDSVPRIQAAETIQATAPDNVTGIAVSVNGATVKSASTHVGASVVATASASLRVGMNTVLIAVTAPDGNNANTYSLSIKRLPGVNPDLSSLSITPGAGIKPAFSAAVLTYNDTLAGNLVGPLNVGAKAVDSGATIVLRLNHTEITYITSGTGVPLPIVRTVVLSTDTIRYPVVNKPLELLPGISWVTAEVTAEDGVTKKTYTVNIDKLPSTVSTLSALVVNPTTGANLALTPAFSSATLAYSAVTTSGFVVITPTATDKLAKITVKGVAVPTGTPSASISLATGANAISIVCTASDGKIISTYNLTVAKQLILITPVK